MVLYNSLNEQRGMIACSKRAYHLIGFGDFCGFIAAIVLWTVIAYWLFRYQGKQFPWRELWWLLLPAAVVVAGKVMEKIGWSLAEKKQYHYDYDSDTVTWLEDGHPCIYPDPETTAER